MDTVVTSISAADTKLAILRAAITIASLIPGMQQPDFHMSQMLRIYNASFLLEFYDGSGLGIFFVDQPDDRMCWMVQTIIKIFNDYVLKGNDDCITVDSDALWYGLIDIMPRTTADATVVAIWEIVTECVETLLKKHVVIVID